ncbi:MAG: DUF4418 family protein [Lachnospiraceae bacterium]|nr:DUF4418 family protein [Lachnospiraceae bacterium]
MKKRGTVSNLLRLILSLVLAVGCRTFISPCIHEDGNYGTCHYAGEVVLVLGILLTMNALLSLIMKNPGTRRGYAGAASMTGVVTALMPGVVIPLCGMNTMRCTMIMRPAVMLLSGVIIALSLFEMFWIREEA